MSDSNHIPAPGESFTVERTFTREDVEQFAAVSGDTQPRHDPDADGPLIVHGLLTATLPTQIGGDLEVLARSMTFEFQRPVYAGDTVRCTWTTETVEERADRYEIEARVSCARVDGASPEGVLTGSVEGLVWKADADTVAGP